MFTNIKAKMDKIANSQRSNEFRSIFLENVLENNVIPNQVYKLDRGYKMFKRGSNNDIDEFWNRMSYPVNIEVRGSMCVKFTDGDTRWFYFDAPSNGDNKCVKFYLEREKLSMRNDDRFWYKLW